MSKNRSKATNPQPSSTEAERSGAAAAAAPAAEPKPPFRAGTKQALLFDLLTREGGASLEEMVAATGWLKHTTRAALTGLRRRGHGIEKEKLDRVTRYRIAAGA